MSAPAYHLSKAHGLLRTDMSPYRGYGKPVSPATVIRLGAARHAERASKERTQ